ncbi:MAG: diguanylate cyclase, partial [Methylomarinum sp.]|nr:diguanylate cyclase [Methylomarinum sp.]
IFNGDMSKYGQIAVGFIDIDNFKQLNDKCGHQAGDDVLKVVADVLRSLTRPGDCIGRYGGEEFLFIHLNTTIDGVTGYAERIRAEVERRGQVLGQRIKCDALTISIGIVMHNSQYSNYYDMIDAADKAMYQAKSKGRNRVILKE